jgi:hypothetical protein
MEWGGELEKGEVGGKTDAEMFFVGEGDSGVTQLFRIGSGDRKILDEH